MRLDLGRSGQVVNENGAVVIVVLWLRKRRL